MSDQLDFFKKPIPPAAPIPPPRPVAKLPASERPGTVLDHRNGNTVKVFGRGPKSGVRTPMGWVDQRQRLYQSGGEATDAHDPQRKGDFIYHKQDCVSLAGDVWVQLRDAWGDTVDWLEMIDNPGRRCFRVAMATAVAEGHWYNAGIGRRWGVPQRLWAQSGPGAE